MGVPEGALGAGTLSQGENLKFLGAKFRGVSCKCTLGKREIKFYWAGRVRVVN